MDRKLDRILYSIIFVGIVLFVSAGQAFASYANASASLDWSRFNISGDVSWILKNTSTSAAVSNSLGGSGATSDLKPGWVSSSSMAAISNVNAQGQISTNLPPPKTPLAASQANLVTYGWSSGTGSAVLTGSFTFTAQDAGFVVIAVPYTVSVNLLATDGSAGYSMGMARALLYLSQSGGSATDTKEVISTVYNGNASVNSKSGWLGLMTWFEAGETGTFRAEVTTETRTANPVPLPGALWLLGPSCAGLVALRRRFHS